MKRFLKWMIEKFYPDLLAGQDWIDRMVREPRFATIRALVEHAEGTKSAGEHKHVYVLTALTSEARRNGRLYSVKDTNFLIELALQLKKRGL